MTQLDQHTSEPKAKSWFKILKRPCLKNDVLALLIILAGISFFHWRGLQPGYVFLPVDLANNILPWREASYQTLHNRLISDAIYEFYPFLAQAVETLTTEYAWPLWNNHIFLGQPSFADPLTQTFYPVYLLLGVLLGAARGLTLGLYLHVLLAAGLMYGYLRTSKAPLYAAMLGAFTYALGGYLVTWLEATHRVTTLSWLPGVLWAFELARQKQDIRYAILGGLALALAILGGQYQFLVIFGLFLGLYTLGYLAQAIKNNQAQIKGLLAVILIIFGLGALLSAFQLLSFANFLSISQRVREQGLADFLPLKQIITLLIPNFYGNPTFPVEHAYWGEILFSEAIIYAGVPSLFLAFLAPFWGKFFSRYLFGLLVLCLYFILGGPGMSWLGLMPVIKYASFRRTAFILPLLMAMLAACVLRDRFSTTSPSESANKINLGDVGPVLGVGTTFMACIALALYTHWDELDPHWPYLMPALGWTVRPFKPNDLITPMGYLSPPKSCFYAMGAGGVGIC